MFISLAALGAAACLFAALALCVGFVIWDHRRELRLADETYEKMRIDIEVKGWKIQYQQDHIQHLNEVRLALHHELEAVEARLNQYSEEIDIFGNRAYVAEGQVDQLARFIADNWDPRIPYLIDSDWMMDALLKHVEPLLRSRNAVSVANVENVPSTYCKHGTYIGDPYGYDHMCGYCENALDEIPF